MGINKSRKRGPGSFTDRIASARARSINGGILTASMCRATLLVCALAACVPIVSTNFVCLAAKPVSVPKTIDASGKYPLSQLSEPETLSVTHHEVSVHGKALGYTATAGRILVGDTTEAAYIFFTAYSIEPAPDPHRRPITFAFNGGPGASSMWLHIAVAGPKRVLLGGNGDILPTVDTLIDNEFTWLGFTDLVFVDPVGTGYSRAVSRENEDKFYSVEGDIKITAQFFRTYLSTFKRWTSPKFIAGESYGTVRAVGLTAYLQDNMSVVPNGIILVSSALDFGTFTFKPGNDIAYALALPSYAATAWYHGKPASAKTSLETVVESAEKWAQTKYLPALSQGAALSAALKNEITDSLAVYTGLPRSFIYDHDMRVDRFSFVRQLLWTQDSIVGILDGRVCSLDPSLSQPYAYSDPSMFVVAGPLTSMINDYLRRDLGYATPLEYIYLSDAVNRNWRWMNPTSQGYLTQISTLRDAMSANSQLRVFSAMGLYDLTTPYLSQIYSLEHMRADSTLLHRVVCKRYLAGHRIYTDANSLKQLSADVSTFVIGR